MQTEVLGWQCHRMDLEERINIEPPMDDVEAPTSEGLEQLLTNNFQDRREEGDIGSWRPRPAAHGRQTTVGEKPDSRRIGRGWSDRWQAARCVGQTQQQTPSFSFQPNALFSTQMAPVAPLTLYLTDRDILHLLFSVTDLAARAKPVGVSDIMWAEAMEKLEGMEIMDRESCSRAGEVVGEEGAAGEEEQRQSRSGTERKQRRAAEEVAAAGAYSSPNPPDMVQWTVPSITSKHSNLV
ncbi:hypothetical protein KSP40_PGU004143 [Platanthera guangdongensis]|uniref:Uncharacterized protein n=1 Tax=Platanthera guangdongensis TaxID=2320717 RepID=A0ABR2M3S7_9ASPA